MPEKISGEIWIAMNSEGDIESGPSLEDAVDRLCENVGTADGFRVIKATAKMSPPQVHDAGEIDIPDEEDDAIEVTGDTA